MGKIDAKRYSLHIDENKTLNSRLKEITTALLECEETDLLKILGADNLKLNSSMTLFYLASGDELYKRVVDKYCGGVLCEWTVGLLES